jgi:hypothetical protein
MQAILVSIRRFRRLAFANARAHGFIQRYCWLYREGGLSEGDQHLLYQLGEDLLQMEEVRKGRE